MAWPQLTNQKTIYAIKYLNIYAQIHLRLSGLRCDEIPLKRWKKRAKKCEKTTFFAAL